MSNISVENLNQIRNFLDDTYINSENLSTITEKAGFNKAQLKIINEMIIQALRLYHFHLTGEEIFDTDSPKIP